jgi:hypothetical protein
MQLISGLKPQDHGYVSTPSRVQPNVWSLGLQRLVVIDVINDTVLLEGLDGETRLKATCAASCLLKPSLGDQVLVHVDSDEMEHFVLSILKRASDNAARHYLLAEDVSLRAESGCLQVNGHSINLEASEAQFKIDKFSGIYKDKSEKADSVLLVANLVKHQIGRVISKIRNSFRLIDGLDRTHASNIQQTAEHQILLKSSITKLRSEHAVKIDAKKIDLG